MITGSHLSFFVAAAARSFQMCLGLVRLQASCQEDLVSGPCAPGNLLRLTNGPPQEEGVTNS